MGRFGNEELVRWRTFYEASKKYFSELAGTRLAELFFYVGIRPGMLFFIQFFVCPRAHHVALELLSPAVQAKPLTYV